jgi:hypothetical protein
MKKPAGGAKRPRNSRRIRWKLELGQLRVHVDDHRFDDLRVIRVERTPEAPEHSAKRLGRLALKVGTFLLGFFGPLPPWI